MILTSDLLDPLLWRLMLVIGNSKTLSVMSRCHLKDLTTFD
jgi:hypothetical protein